MDVWFDSGSSWAYAGSLDRAAITLIPPNEPRKWPAVSVLSSLHVGAEEGDVAVMTPSPGYFAGGQGFIVVRRASVGGAASLYLVFGVGLALSRSGFWSR